MALVSTIVEQAFREGNIVGENSFPTPRQANEAVTLLNGLVSAAVGYEVGDGLADLTLGGEWDQSWSMNGYVPENARLVLASGGATTVQLHPSPYDGQRFAIADAGRNLATANLTLDGNGRLVEGTATKVLTTNGLVAGWLYRADLGDWKRIEPLEAGDAFPFPAEFDDYFSILLAMRLASRFGGTLPATSAAWLERMSAQIQARYRKPRPVQDWGSLGLLHQRRWDYGGWSPLR